jgi:cytochrome c oxidase assembly protein subunit 15
MTGRRTTDQPTAARAPYDGTPMGRLRISPRTFRWVTLAAAILLAFIIITGAAVRLTGSGLGCPEWPNCTKGSLQVVRTTDEHQAIESINRAITGLVSVAVILAVLGSLVRTPRRTDLVWLSLGLVVGVIAQALLGALVVQELLDPPFVMGHFLLSAVLLADAIYLHHRAGLPDGRRTRPAVAPVVVWLGRALMLAVAVVLVTGTVVTGAGPHSGDAGSKDLGLKATRLDIPIPDAARIHGTSVMVFLALTLVTLAFVIRLRAPQRVYRRIGILLGLLVAQAAIGYIQYFNGVPAGLVGVHVAGATAVFAATLALLLGCYAPVAAEPVVDVTAEPPAARPADLLAGT